jgi:hypothetical protein
MRITASHIIDWVNNRAKEAQAELPRWVRKLCYQAGSTREIAFPAGDSTYRPGWDGKLFCDQGNAWVPPGASRWEMGCDADVDGKANREYNKRTKATDSAERTSTTFVFVTPRRWLKKDAWIASQRTKTEWHDIKVVDADDLEQWLEQDPAVALQFAEFLGLLGPGVESLERFWLRWSGQCNPSITREAFFTDRAATTQQLHELARDVGTKGYRLITLRADSIEEAVAFASASFLELPELADRALVVTEVEGWRYVDANPQLRIAIAASSEAAVHATRRNGLLLVVPHAAGDMTGQKTDQELLLERPSIYDLEKALSAMGIEESDARRVALSTGRSWSVLRRHRSNNPAVRHPAWLDMPQAASLATVCLLGAWNAEKNADRWVVETVADQPYEVIETNLRHLAYVDDSPILHIGSVWKAKSPLELLDLFGSRITSSQLGRFFQVAAELLGTPDPQLELPESERYAAQIHGKVHPQSGLLFESLCDTLIKLAVRGPDIPALLNLNIEGRVARLVSDLLENADRIRWLSLASYLPALAETAPNTFLRAVENSLDYPDAPVAKLILETTDTGFGGRCWHAGLLWALETLAWSPKWLVRVAYLLARLTHVPYNNRWGNTPGSSLLGLFRAWLPQTAADLPARLKVLGSLVQFDPDAAFDLLDAITKRGPQHATPATRPKWRDDDAGAGNGVSWSEQRDMNLAARERMHRLSVGHASRLVRLFENTDMTDGEQMARVLNLMRPFTLEDANDEERVALQAALRRRLHWHRNYDDSSDEARKAQLTTLDALYGDLAPADPIHRHLWIFSSHWPELPMCDEHDINLKDRLILEARTTALNEMIESRGMAGIRRLIAECGEPHTVGLALAKRNQDTSGWPEWIILHGGDFQPASPVSQCIGGLLRSLPEQGTQAILREVLEQGASEDWDAKRQARLLALAPAVKTSWELATARGPDTDEAYWRCVSLFGWMRDWGDDATYVLQRLLEVHRPRTALQCCRFDLEKTDARLLFELLQRFLQGEEAEGPRPESWDIEKVLERLEQSCEIDKAALIQLEFMLFPALCFGDEARATALFGAVTSDPAIFAELVSLVYKSEHGEREETITDAQRYAASNALDIIQACKRQPGTRADGSIDPDAFIQFIDAAREHCRQADRLSGGEYVLGEILAHAPADDDGTWPFAPARQVLDRPELEEMRRGFHTGAINKRGVTSRGPWDGGNQERELAAYYRNHAQTMQHDQPRVAELLESLASSYEHDGVREDNEADLRKERF